MQLRAVLSSFALTIGVAHAQSIDPAPRGLGLPPPAPAPASAGPATPAPDPTAPAPEPPPGAIAPPTDPDNLPPDALPLAIAPAATTVVVDPLYPRALVERPNVLPGGTIEASLAFAYARSELIADKTFTALGVSPHVSYAVGRFGLSAGADVILDVTPDVTMFAGQSFEFQDEQRLSAAYASARFAPTPDLSMRVQFVGQALTTAVPRTTTALASSYKLRLSSRFAVIPSLAVGFSRTTYDDVTRNISESRTALVSSGRLGAQVQVAPLVAVVAHSSIGLRYEGAENPFADVLMGQPGVTLSSDHGLALLGSLTQNIDLTAGAVLFLGEQPAVVQLALGFSVRTP